MARRAPKKMPFPIWMGIFDTLRIWREQNERWKVDLSTLHSNIYCWARILAFFFFQWSYTGLWTTAIQFRSFILCHWLSRIPELQRRNFSISIIIWVNSQYLTIRSPSHSHKPLYYFCSSGKVCWTKLQIPTIRKRLS